MTATAQGEAARDAVAFRGTTPVIDGPLMGHERCHVETLWRFLGMLHSSPKSGIATSRSSCAEDLHQNVMDPWTAPYLLHAENIRASRYLRCGILCTADPGMGWLSVSPKAPNLLRKPPHAYGLFLPTPEAKIALKLSSALLFELIHLPYGFRSSLLFAISCGSWRPGNSTLPLLHNLEIFYGVISLHRLQTTSASKVPLEGLSALSTPPQLSEKASPCRNQ